MREILFRGKRKDNGEWFFGDLLHNCDCVKIRENEAEINHVARSFPVLPKTIGQYTGLTDNKGVRIFEGDIVKITGFHTTAIAAVKYGSPSEKSTSWGWYFDDNDGHTYFLESQAFCKDYNAIIIGNIHDNPELLKGE